MFHRAKKASGGKDQDRTGDTRIFNPLLYQLSYPATGMVFNIHPIRCFSSRKAKKTRKKEANEAGSWWEEQVVRGEGKVSPGGGRAATENSHSRVRQALYRDAR